MVSEYKVINNHQLLIQKLQKQLEFYLSRTNLSGDHYLVSQMNSELYVPLNVLANFPKVRGIVSSEGGEISEIINFLREACSTSPLLVLDAERERVRPNFQLKRNTLLLRGIPSSSTAEQVQEFIRSLLTDFSSSWIKSIKGDIADTWYVEMADEQLANSVIDAIRRQVPEWGAPGSGLFVSGRVKSESLLKNTANQQPYPLVNPAAAAILPSTTTNNYYAFLGADWQQQAILGPPFPPRNSSHRTINESNKTFSAPRRPVDNRHHLKSFTSNSNPNIVNNQLEGGRERKFSTEKKFNTSASSSTNNNNDNNNSNSNSTRKGNYKQQHLNHQSTNNRSKSTTNNSHKTTVLIKDEANFPSLSPSMGSSEASQSETSSLKGFASVAAASAPTTQVDFGSKQGNGSKSSANTHHRKNSFANYK